MSNLYWLDRVQPEDRIWVGNKAFHLARLLQGGYPVVEGFVVSAQTLRECLKIIDWNEPLFSDLPYSSLRLDIANSQQLQTIARQLRQAFESVTLPTEWVEELSAAAKKFNTPVVVLRPSLALVAETRESNKLNLEPVIHGHSSALFSRRICGTTAQELAAGLKQIWAELFGAKSLFYWQRQRILLQQVRLAVLVQPLQAAIASGIAQAVGTEFQVQATAGLGMAIANGEVTPDVYQIDSRSGDLLSRCLGRKTIVYEVQPPATHHEAHSDWIHTQFLDAEKQQQFALEETQLSQITQLMPALVAELGTPLEIEWMFANDARARAQLLLTQVIPHLSIGGLPPAKPHLAAPLISETTGSSTTSAYITGQAAAPGRTTAPASVIDHAKALPADVLPGTVLIAANLMPQWLPLIKNAAAIVTEQGSMTSHSAIIAREMGIPAVMGAVNATQLIKTGDWVTVDGDRGLVYQANPDQVDHLNSEQKEPLTASFPANFFPLESADRPPIGTQLMVNLSQPESLHRLDGLPIDGIGLLRSELLAVALSGDQPLNFWLREGNQTEWVDLLAEALSQFAIALAPRPVLYRSLDLRSHEFRQFAAHLSDSEAANPALGMRGTFSYIHYPVLFNLELKALAKVQQRGHDNIRLLLPFVRSVEEFRFCRQKAEQVGLTNHSQFQLWMMAEVPSVLFLLAEYVEAGVQGISIGSNDLTQLLLGIDRDYAPLASAFDERHPAVKAAIAQLIKQAHQNNIPCSICGQAPVDYPELVEDLVRWGISSISVDLESVESTYWAIARAERRLLLESARQQG